MSVATAEEVGLPDWALEALRSIGLTDPDPDDALHVRLVNAVLRLGPGAARGVQLSAMRFEFAWALKEAGQEFAEAKANYEHAFARAIVRERAEAAANGEKMPVSHAERLAEVEAYVHKLTYLLAEQRERAMRKFLDAIEAAVDTWRTLRADERAADRAHAGGYSGGA